MAPASASPQPPADRSDIARSAGQGSDIAQGGGHGSNVDCREEGGQREQVDKQDGVYGPLGVERLVKEDGRALILYTRRERRHE